MHPLRFRQIHLDFHTSPEIADIGARFDPKVWQERLKLAHADSITCFSVCHHGWSYHPTEVGKMHPHLNFNLLKQQFDASKEINVNVPVYLSAGLNYRVYREHPEWRETYADNKCPGPFHAGFVKLCFNTPYLDHLCALIDEAVRMFPGADGVFLDIVHQGQCCCDWCLRDMLNAGLDPEREVDRKLFARRTLLKYYRQTTAAAQKYNPLMPVFHNNGHIAVGDREILPYLSHLELESLPTGGWGYDHFPMSAAYCRNLPFDFLGMTGKFHSTWGEFGGVKHPNALVYECASMLANGAKCSIGDQLHPDGELEESTCRAIGEAYAQVEAKEPWCDQVQSLAQIAIVASPERNNADDVGASRMLLEMHLPFDIVDEHMAFDRYQTLLLSGAFALSPALEAKLARFCANGGKLILAGNAGVRTDDTLALDLPAEDGKWSEFMPDFIRAAEPFAPQYARTAFVMYQRSRRIKVSGGESLGAIYDPYFNRNYRHFCSHRHAPSQPAPSGYDAGVLTDHILYFAHPVFAVYRNYGMTALRDFVRLAIFKLLGEEVQFQSNLPGTARVTLMMQPQHRRAILHLLYADTVLRGGGDPADFPPGQAQFAKGIEVIEDITPLYEVQVELKPPFAVNRAAMVPQNTPLSFAKMQNGNIKFVLPKLYCHQMIELS